MDESELVRSGSDLLRGLLKKFLEFVVSEFHHTIFLNSMVTLTGDFLGVFLKKRLGLK